MEKLGKDCAPKSVVVPEWFYEDAKLDKKRYPKMFADYQARCSRGEVRPGTPYLYESAEIQILNFQTKRDWRENSHLEDIESGLKYLAEKYSEMGIFYLALPPLGCGLGGLNWSDVRNLIDKYLGSIPVLEVLVYEPAAAQTKASSDRKRDDASTSGEGLAARP